jgi:tripartite-type tricarboxylate transporter receptor subunit TctC
MVVGLVLCAAVAMIAPASHAAEFVKGVLQPLPDGFPNRQIVIVVVDDPGTADSIYAMSLVEVAKKMSPVPVVLEHRTDLGDLGNWAALAWIRDQGKIGSEGYVSIVGTQPGNMMDAFAIDLKTEIGMDLQDYNYVVMTEFGPYFFVQRANAPWGDKMQDLVAYAKKNPETVRFISGGISSGSGIAMYWYAHKLGFTFKEIIGGGIDARTLAVAAGEGDITVTQPGILLPHYQAGKLKPLMVAGSVPVPGEFSSVPTAESLGLKGDPYGTYRGLVTIGEVSESHRAWLAQLFSAAAQDDAFLSKRKQIPALVQKIYDKPTMVKITQNAWDFSLPLVRATGGYWADQPKKK